MLRVITRVGANVPSENVASIMRIMQEMSFESRIITSQSVYSSAGDTSYFDLETADIYIFVINDYLSDDLRTAYLQARDKGKLCIIILKQASRLRSIKSELEINPDSQDRTTILCYNSTEELARLLKASLADMITIPFRLTPRITRDREEHYNLAIQLISNAKHRINMIERTPVLLLGPGAYYYEQEFHDVLKKWCESTITDTQRRCQLLFCIPETREEIIAEQKKATFLEMLKKYKELERQSRGRFSLSALPQYSGSFIIADDKSAIWFKGKDKSISLTYEHDQQVADILVEIQHRLVGERVKTETEIINEFSLPAKLH